MANKRALVSVGKFFGLSFTMSFTITLGLMVVVDKHIENEISNIHNYVDSLGVAAIPETLKVGDAVVATPSILFIHVPPNTLFVPSPPSSTIVIHRETLTVFDTVRVEREKPNPMWWDDPRRVGRIWSL